MRKVSNNVKAFLSSNGFQTYYLFVIKGVGIDVKYTTFSEDMTVAGLGTFDSSHSVVEFKPPVMEKASNREAYKISFADPDFDFRATAELNLLGCRATFYMGVINTFDYEVGGAAPGAPLKNLEDLIVGFDGVIDGKEYSINPFENVCTFSIECSSPMASLGITKAYMTSKEAVRQINGNDSAYDLVYQGSAGVGLKWGQ